MIKLTDNKIEYSDEIGTSQIVKYVKVINYNADAPKHVAGK
jgi:hypothetical protein